MRHVDVIFGRTQRLNLKQLGTWHLQTKWWYHASAKRHQKHWSPQGAFPANAVSNHSNQYAPQGPCHIASRKCHEGLHDLHGGILTWKEMWAYNLGHCGIDPEVIPLQPIAQSCCQKLLIDLSCDAQSEAKVHLGKPSSTTTYGCVCIIIPKWYKIAMLGWILMIDNVIPGYPIFQSNPSNHYCLRFLHLESQWPQADADCNWSCYPAGFTNHCSWIIGEVPYSDDSTLDWCFKIKQEHIIPVSSSAYILETKNASTESTEMEMALDKLDKFHTKNVPQAAEFNWPCLRRLEFFIRFFRREHGWWPEGRGVAAVLVKSHVSRVEGPHNLEITHQIAV